MERAILGHHHSHKSSFTGMSRPKSVAAAYSVVDSQARLISGSDIEQSCCVFLRGLLAALRTLVTAKVARTA